MATAFLSFNIYKYFCACLIKSKLEKMTRAFQIITLTFVLFGLAGCKQEEPERLFDKEYSEVIKEIRKELLFYMTSNSIPGGSISVSIDGKTVWSEGIGIASKDLDVPAKRNTKFRIGKITQLLTALTYENLVAENILHPDSTIQAYVPEFPVKKEPISIQHLVNHTSGIRPPTEKESDYYGIYRSLKQGLKDFENDELMYPPGVLQNLSMFNYNLLGVAIENATKKRFYEVMKNYVIDTLGLDNTVPDNVFASIKGRSNFYDLNYISQLRSAVTKDLRFKLPSEGYLSTADDLVKLVNMLLKPGIIDKKICDKFFTPSMLSAVSQAKWVNGWYKFEDTKNNVFFGARAEVYGGGGTLMVCPEKNIVIAYLLNVNDKMDEAPVLRIAGNFIDFINPQEEKESN